MGTAFITGCGSGFGQTLARRMLADGWRVVATDPRVGSLDGLGPTDRVLTRALDVRDDAAVRRVAREALDWSPVDVVVNNGGYAIFGSQEEADLEAIRDLFDVNVLGAARVTQALLPTLRERAGTVVQISSIAGRMTFPESGFYAATKHALEALSEALFEETCTFGVRVRLIEPGSFATRFLETARAASRPRSADSPYANLHAVWDTHKLQVLEPPQDPQRVADAILASLHDPTPFLRVPVGPDAARILGLRASLPADGWTLLLGRRNGLDGPTTRSDAVLLPHEVLAGRMDAATQAAFRAGHLAHWEETEEGVRALARLAEIDALRA